MSLNKYKMSSLADKQTARAVEEATVPYKEASKKVKEETPVKVEKKSRKLRKIKLKTKRKR